MPESRSQPPRLITALGFALVSLVVVSTMLDAGAFHTEFGSDPDEAGHLLSGLVAHDYLASGFSEDPLSFAERYYVHYPKVAIGHWPPFFYAVQAVWFAGLGVGSAQAMLLQALVFTVLGCLFFVAARQLAGAGAAALMSTLLLVAPIAASATSKFLADGFVTLLMLASWIALSRYLAQPRSLTLLAATGMAILAAFAKANGLSLALIFPLAILLCGRLELLRSKSLWLVGSGAVLLVSLWYAPTLDPAIKGLGANPLSASEKPGHLSGWVVLMGMALGPLAGGLLAIGVLAALAGKTQNPMLARACVAYVLGWLAFHVLVSPPLPRLLLSVLPICGLLACVGIRWIYDRWPRSSLTRPAVLAAASLAVFLVVGFRPPIGVTRGYAEAWKALPRENPVRVILAVSDPRGEGALVAQARLQDPLWQTVVLRGSQVLSQSDWSGGGYELRFGDAGELREFLEQTPVDYVVMDSCVSARAHYAQLAALFRSETEQFPLLVETSVERPPPRAPCSLRIHRVRLPGDPDHVRIAVGTRNLSRPIELVLPRKQLPPGPALRSKTSGAGSIEERVGLATK